ncbi:MAG: hypothetical protein ACK4KW_02620, partial [Gemmobacter sp.]
MMRVVGMAAALAAAVVMHLGLVWWFAGRAGGAPSGAGGAEAVTLVAASGDLAALVARWDAAPTPAEAAPA